METKYYFIATALLTHIIFGIRYQRQIMNSVIFEKKQKIINTVLIWIIPFIWFAMLKIYMDEDNPTMTKKLRRKHEGKDRESGGFYESKKGFYS